MIVSMFYEKYSLPNHLPK